jgi:selenocysteine-specific elongation factor
VDAIRARLADEPFAAPEAGDLTAAGLGSRELAAAVRDGQLERIAEGIYLAPGVTEEARARLASLPQPFTLSQARQAWGTSRRVAVPLAEWLDARGVTVRQPDSTRRLR